jgi:hypothetical protein
MQTKFKIVETEEYLLAVSDEEIKEGEYCLADIYASDFYGVVLYNGAFAKHYFRKIIAYQPKVNAPELDLPLLPPFKKEIVGYRLKPNIDRFMVDGILKTAMPIWNDEDKSVYFIKGHVAGSLVAKMKELQVLDLWFTPIYEEVKSNWVKEHHLEYYYKEGIMSDEIVVEDDVEKLGEEYANFSNDYIPMSFGDKFNETSKRDFIAGYKAATKVYSEEDLRKAIRYGFDVGFCSNLSNKVKNNLQSEDEFIQSLKQPKTPKWFIAEITGGGEYLAGVVGGNEIWAEYPTELKTTTNSEGKQVLVGTYLYK